MVSTTLYTTFFSYLFLSIQGVDTEEKCLIDILSSRSNMEIFQIKEAYLMRKLFYQVQSSSCAMCALEVSAHTKEQNYKNDSSVQIGSLPTSSPLSIHKRLKQCGGWAGPWGQWLRAPRRARQMCRLHSQVLVEPRLRWNRISPFILYLIIFINTIQTMFICDLDNMVLV
ncbi:hypothetical protein Nmel_007032 [Mimus melanotis]